MSLGIDVLNSEYGYLPLLRRDPRKSSSGDDLEQNGAIQRLRSLANYLGWEIIVLLGVASQHQEGAKNVEEAYILSSVIFRSALSKITCSPTKDLLCGFKTRFKALLHMCGPIDIANSVLNLHKLDVDFRELVPSILSRVVIACCST